MNLKQTVIPDNALFLKPNSLNIFCDASISKVNEGFNACSAAIGIIRKDDKLEVKSIESQIYSDCTNNRAELFGIFKALELIFMANSENYYDTINIFCDSKISVLGMREWIFNWVNSVKDGVMFSSSGNPVANQELILIMVYIIIENKLKINFYHQDGHVGNDSDLNEAVSSFYKSNGINISHEEMNILAGFNNFVDVYSRNVLKADTNGELNNFMKNYKFPFIPNAKNLDMNLYKQLIGCV